MNLVRVGLLAAAFAAAAGCAQTPPAPLNLSETKRATATVESIDAERRLVVLRNVAGGDAMIVQAGPQVRNFAQIQPGDRVTVEYRESLVAEKVKPGTGETAVGRVGSRAAPGERPGAAATEFVRFPVKVFDVDPFQGVIEVVGPRGYNQRIRVTDPKAREFIRRLQRGDEVEVTFSEAAAIAVEGPR